MLETGREQTGDVSRWGARWKRFSPCFFFFSFVKNLDERKSRGGYRFRGRGTAVSDSMNGWDVWRTMVHSHFLLFFLPSSSLLPPLPPFFFIFLPPLLLACSDIIIAALHISLLPIFIAFTTYHTPFFLSARFRLFCYPFCFVITNTQFHSYSFFSSNYIFYYLGASSIERAYQIIRRIFLYSLLFCLLRTLCSAISVKVADHPEKPYESSRRGCRTYVVCQYMCHHNVVCPIVYVMMPSDRSSSIFVY